MSLIASEGLNVQCKAFITHNCFHKDSYESITTTTTKIMSLKYKLPKIII